MAKGYSQRSSIDYGYVIAPVARLETSNDCFSAVQNKWTIYQMEVELAIETERNSMLEKREILFLKISLNYFSMACHVSMPTWIFIGSWIHLILTLNT